MASVNDRRIRDVRDIWNCGLEPAAPPAQPPGPGRGPESADTRTKHKYKTLERHLSMKKTIRKKMMRDLREIGDAGGDTAPHSAPPAGFLDQIKNDQPPPASIDKPSLWKRLTKGWGHS